MPKEPHNPALVKDDAEQARQLAARYHCQFVDLTEQRINTDLFRLIPVDMMFRHHFIPLEATDGALALAMADPSQFFVVDELAIRLGRSIVVKVATREQIADILKKSEQSQRVLEEVTEGFRLDVVRETEEGEETISVERLTRDTSRAPSSAWSNPPSSTPWSGAPATSTSRPRTPRSSSSTASTACSTPPWPRWPRSGTPPSSPASR